MPECVLAASPALDPERVEEFARALCRAPLARYLPPPDDPLELSLPGLPLRALAEPDPYLPEVVARPVPAPALAVPPRDPSPTAAALGAVGAFPGAPETIRYRV